MRKTFHVNYSLQSMDGIEEIDGYILAEDKTDTEQQLRQIAKDLNVDDIIIDIIQEIKEIKK